MRVRNKTDHGVYVDGHGVIPGDEEATVRESEQTKQLIRDGVLAKVATTAASDSNKKKEGDG